MGEKRALKLRRFKRVFKIRTGGDDGRSDSTVEGEVKLGDGREINKQLKGGGESWDNNTSHESTIET